jgi:hypothetical protein
MHNRGDLLIVKEPLVRVTARETSPLYFLRSFIEKIGKSAIRAHPRPFAANIFKRRVPSTPMPRA